MRRLWRRPKEPWELTLWLMVISQLLSQIGFSLVIPFLPLYIETLGIHDQAQAALWAGVLTTLSGLAMALMAPIWGALADRWGRKSMVVRATLGGSLIVGAMGLVHSVGALLALRILQGLVTGTIAAGIALVSGILPEAAMGYGMGLMQTAVFLGGAAGPLVGGFLADQLSFRPTFGLTAIILALSGAMVLWGVREPRGAGRARRAPTERLQLKGSPLTPLILVNFFDQFANSAAAPFLPLFVADLSGNLGSAATLTGLILGTVAVAATISAVLSGRLADRLAPRTIIVVCAVGAAFFSLLQTFAPSVASLWALRFVMGLFIGGTIPSANALLSRLTPEPLRGTAFGYASSASALGFSVGPLIGALIAAYAIRLPFALTALMFALEALWVARTVPGRSQVNVA